MLNVFLDFLNLETLQCRVYSKGSLASKTFNSRETSRSLTLEEEVRDGGGSSEACPSDELAYQVTDDATDDRRNGKANYNEPIRTRLELKLTGGRQGWKSEIDFAFSKTITNNKSSN